MSYEGGMEVKVITSCKLGKESQINPCTLSPNNPIIVLYVYSLLIPLKCQLCALCQRWLKI